MQSKSTFRRVFLLQCILLGLLVGTFTWGSISDYQGNSHYLFLLGALPFFTIYFTSAYMNYYLGTHGLVEAPTISIVTFKTAGIFLKETKGTSLKFIYYAFMLSIVIFFAMVTYSFLQR
jgi:hypothetical protein